MTLTIGISTCPNDTFAFAALLERRVPGPELAFVLEDIEALNERLLRAELDVAKASFHAALHVADEYVVLPVGSALGFGVGPLMLSARDGDAPPHGRVLCPGKWTTATLLYRLFFPDGPEPEQVVFSEIMPALARGEADFGVVIHEGRFTYGSHGLHLHTDLGTRWEEHTSAPLPLGGLVARRSLGSEMHAVITGVIRASLEAARADPDSALPVMQRYAQEMERAVLDEHVRLYVNEATLELGVTGRAALARLAELALAAGVIDRPVDLCDPGS